MILTMAYGDHHDNEPTPTIELNDLPWNTHKKIREWFGHPLHSEFFSEWLIFFYDSLTHGQRHALRKSNLDELDRKNFPNPPSH